MTKVVPAAIIAALLSGCASSLPPDVLSYSSPVDAQEGIRDSHHHNIIGDYNHRTVVEPKNWRDLNREQTPKKGHE